MPRKAKKSPEQLAEIEQLRKKVAAAEQAVYEAQQKYQALSMRLSELTARTPPTKVCKSCGWIGKTFRRNSHPNRNGRTSHRPGEMTLIEPETRCGYIWPLLGNVKDDLRAMVEVAKLKGLTDETT